MDILNFISWIASKRRVVKTLNKTDLIPIGVRTETRDDKYTTVAITTEDFIAQIPIPEPTYKVYTALLTQSGGNNFQSISSGPLTIGVTYQIISQGANDDFTNVGAPNNNLGTYFVATGTTPNVFDAGELEYNTGAPVVTVLENTIGNIWFEYVSSGNYRINSSGLFDLNKTFILNQAYSGYDSSISVVTTYVNNLQIVLGSLNLNVASDNLIFTPTSIEIRVYN
jgi:hypothetical protein